MTSKDIAAAPIENSSRTQTHDAVTAAEQCATRDLRGTQPRDNFPLPRELRDQIYSYLLDGKRNQIKRAEPHSRPDRIFYKFHTSILAVNRRIHDEAEEYLYKHNEFIVVNHDLIRDPNALMPPWIPVVAELGTRSMRYHSLEITLLLRHGVDRSETAVAAWLLMAQDIEIYCLAINHYISSTMYCLHPQTPMLSLHQNSSLHDYHCGEDGRPLRPHYLRLDFRSHRFHRTAAESQSALISRFRSMHSSSLHVEICGHVIQTPELTNFRTAARPGLMCTSSLAWRAFWDLDSLKELADRLIHDSELELANDVCRQIWRNIASVNPRQLPHDVRRPTRHLLLDTALDLTHLHLKSKDTPPFVVDVLNKAYSRRRAFPDLVKSRIFHALLLLAVTSGLPFAPLLEATIAECMTHLTLPGSDSHQLHDASILSKCPDHNKRFECKDLPVESCSAYALPPNCINLRKAGEGVVTRDSIDGWLDTEMLRGTNQETREEINRLQVARGWQVTRFENYD